MDFCSHHELAQGSRKLLPGNNLAENSICVPIRTTQDIFGSARFVDVYVLRDLSVQARTVSGAVSGKGAEFSRTQTPEIANKSFP